MMNQLHPLEAYSIVFNMLEDRELEDDVFKGWLCLDEEKKEMLDLLVQHELSSGSYQCNFNGAALDPIDIRKIADKHLNESFKFRVTLVQRSQRKATPIFRDWNDLLGYPNNLKNPLQQAFFTSSALMISENSDDPIFQNYQRVAGLIEVVELLIESNEGSGQTLFYQRPIKFDFVLEAEDLEHSIDIDAINNLLEKDTHKEAVKNLISAQIVSRVKDIPVGRRFAELVRINTYLVADVLLDYQGYVENYSFDKVRKEYLEKKTDYISKIENRFDEISLKLLSLPAGIGLATTQIEAGMIGDLAFVKNVTVVATVFVLVMLLCMNIYGQFSVIKSIKLDYESAFEALEKKFSEESSAISTSKNEIDEKCFFTWLKLWVAIAASLALFVITFIMLIYSYR
ncbi:hypothetical protein MAQ5080_03315 [Marinomonas aquimarina]|uniref:Uncharacterized protein n=1 Tax=Marinomonas aquimarina TaxID=295068 RepID=A0A1A8TPT6_9GAMM|nr:hypothetical protein [Marinomonas aquimarina]SBS35935.1 hypothetical protein MAQ5080_03315 [Marinomonas aquimarina]